MKYNSRKYSDGDAQAINSLYYEVTGRNRTLEAFSWQWLNAPAGQGDMYLIEAVEENGTPRIIGHHGLMPIFFSKGEKTYIGGKTENTMVHSHFRGKVLYHGYERRFLKDYSARFDLLFSTIGPTAALRQRKALGYDDTRHWLRFHIGLTPLALPNLILALAAQSDRASWGFKYRFAERVLNLISCVLAPVQRLLRCRTPLSAELEVHDDVHAKSAPFFETFWKKARSEYPLTPRRMQSDLAWRFWDNPNISYTTLVHPAGYAIVSRPHQHLFRLEDIVAFPYDQEHFQALLKVVSAWCADQGASALSILTTDDPRSPANMIINSGLTLLDTRWMRKQVNSETKPAMLRKVTARGEGDGASVEDWYITSFVTEGVS